MKKTHLTWLNCTHTDTLKSHKQQYWMNSNQSGEAQFELANSIYEYWFLSCTTPDQSSRMVLLSKWRLLKIVSASSYSYPYSEKSRLPLQDGLIRLSTPISFDNCRTLSKWQPIILKKAGFVRIRVRKTMTIMFVWRK